MTDISSLGGSSAYALAIQQLQQQLFQQADINGDGNVTQAELEQAVTNAGGTATSADALYAQLDPNNTGSVNQQQFAQNLPLPYFSPEMGAQFIADQAQNSGTGSDPATQFKENLFSQLTNGSGTLTQSELEQAVTNAGGTTQAADALYAQLDPNNTGSVSEQQFVQNLPTPHFHHHHGGGAEAANASTSGDSSTTTDGGDSADDALMALLQNLAPPAGTTASTGDTSSQTSDGSTYNSTATLLASLNDNGEQTALAALVDNFGTSSQSLGTSTTGNSADDALLALLNSTNNASASPTATAGATSTSAASGDSTSTAASTPATLFANFNQQILALLLQMQQSQSLAA